MRERVLAILGAVALVAVALLVRSWLAGDGGSGDGGSGDGGSKVRPVVACTPDLAAICEALADDGRIADDPPTFDLDDPEVPPDVDGWITWDPAPRIDDLGPSTGADTWEPAAALGASPLALLVPSDVQFGDDCAWDCVLSFTQGDPSFTIALGSPTTAEGLARWHPVADALVADGSFVDLDSGAIRRIQDGPQQAQDSITLDTFLTQQGLADLYLHTEGTLRRAADRQQARDRGLTVFVPDPETMATVVVASRAGEGSAALADEIGGEALTDALDAAGVNPGGTLVDEARAGDLWQLWSKGRP